MNVSKAQNAGNLTVFKALQRRQTIKYAPSLRDAAKQSKCSVVVFDRSQLRSANNFLSLDCFPSAKTISELSPDPRVRTLGRSFELLARFLTYGSACTSLQVVIDHAHGLHKGIHGGGPHK